MTDFEQRKQAKRYRARLRRYGYCSVCMYREKAEAGDHYHCRKWPERQGGCDEDGKLPAFRFDPEVMQDLQGE